MPGWRKKHPRAPFPPDFEDLAEWDARRKTVARLTFAAFAAAQLFVWPYAASWVFLGVLGECGKPCDTPTNRELAWLMAPAVGPFIAAARLGDRIDGTERGLLLADGALQSVGLLTTAASLLIARSVQSQPWPSQQRASITFAPIALSSGGGLGVTGSF